MISLVFSIPLRALIVVAVLPTPPALGALSRPSAAPQAVMAPVAGPAASAPYLPVHPYPTPAFANNAGSR